MTSDNDWAVELLFDDIFTLPPDGTKVKVTIVRATAEEKEVES